MEMPSNMFLIRRKKKMFEDLITEKPDGPKSPSKKINLKDKYDTDRVVCIEFLEDVQEVLWDLEQGPCFHCGASVGSQHKQSCLFRQVLEELARQLAL